MSGWLTCWSCGDLIVPGFVRLTNAAPRCPLCVRKAEEQQMVERLEREVPVDLTDEEEL